MKIVFIGSGNLATHLATALVMAGENVVQVYSKTYEHAQILADKVRGVAVSSIDEICNDADAYIISIKDDALPSVVEQLRKGRADRLFVHTAGSVPMSVLGSHAAVLYPMQTFSKSREVNFREIPCFIEATDDEAYKLVAHLAHTVSDKVVDLDSDKRRKLHLSAVFACNFVNHCYHLAERIMADAGLDFDLLLPLIDETARKVHRLSPHDAQTGPMVRNDRKVMDKQMELISDERTQEIYKLLAESIYKMR